MPVYALQIITIATEFARRHTAHILERRHLVLVGLVEMIVSTRVVRTVTSQKVWRKPESAFSFSKERKSEIELGPFGGTVIQLPMMTFMGTSVIYLRTLHILSFLMRLTSFGS